ncbi:MAG: hypothetical protein M1515_01870, partial [Candidatus Thermoplasmatota archaeon]|nr:hypothetical protein [Candidatus Thermoplasmatota archaeon]
MNSRTGSFHSIIHISITAAIDSPVEKFQESFQEDVSNLQLGYLYIMTVQSVGETEVNGIRKEEIFETYLSEFNYLFRGIRDFMTKFWVCHGVCMNSGIRTVELLPLLEVAIKIYIQNSVKSPLDKPKV